MPLPVPTLVYQSQLAPWDGSLASNSTVLGCGGSDTSHKGWALAQGFVNGYASSSEVYRSPCIGAAFRAATSEDVYDGFYGASFQWTRATGSYSFSANWGIGFRASANASAGTGDCSASVSWSLRAIANVVNENTRAYLVSDNLFYNITAGALVDACGTYSMVSPWALFSYIVPGGIRLIQGDWYQPSSQIWLHTSAVVGSAGSADAAVDVWSMSAQANYAQLISYEIY